MLRFVCPRVRCLLVLVLLAAACSSKKIKVGTSCLLNSDCDSPLVCSMGKCHEACRETRDCPAGQSCMRAGGAAICQLPTEAECRASVACGPLWICAGDLRCRANCNAAADCTPGQACAQGFCAEAAELVNGALPQPLGLDAGGPDAGPDVPLPMTDTPPACPAGEETCACYGNDTCNPGLTCASHLCVRLAMDAGASEAGRIIGTGGKTGTGGATGTGGQLGTGGQFGTGGLTGTGGSTPTGGAGGCAPDCTVNQECSNGVCLDWGGRTCTTHQDCVDFAICCDTSYDYGDRCDGTRLPAGDGTNLGQLEVGGDGLSVADTITGMVWQRDGSGSRAGCANDPYCTWDEAIAYCAGLSLGGQSEWRLPARMELLTIVDYARHEPAIDVTAFPGTPSEWFWTSMPYAGLPSTAWYVDFAYGIAFQDGVSSAHRVRCVR